MTEATTPENQETVQISDMTQFIAILTAWHKKRADELIYYSTIPDGGHIGVILSDENGADVEHVLQGDTLKGFKAGINVALVALGKLPFIFEMEAAPEASETPPAAPALVGDEQADAYLTEPGRLESLARSHPAGLVRALARAALAALAKCDPAWRQGQRELLQYVARRACDPALPVDVVRAAHAAIPDELAARLRKAAATLAVRHSSYSNISIAWPDEKLLKSAEGRYHQALADLDALISAIPTETKQTADRDQLDSLARKNLGALLNAFGEAQWQAGRGVPCPSIEDAFEAVISAAVDLLAAAPQAPAAPSSVAGDWDGKLPEQLQRALNALRLECPPAVVADVEHEVRSCYEALHTSLATTRRMYGAARDRLEALDAAQPDPFAPALEAPAAPVALPGPANLPHHPV